MARKASASKNNTFNLVVAVVLVLGIGLIAFVSLTGEKIPRMTGQESGQLSEQVFPIDPETGYSLGSADAPITLVEFGDYQCPACAAFHTQVFAGLKEKYIDTGKVRYVAKDYPLSIHPQAKPVAAYANCAAEQGKYWELREAIYANQQDWSGRSDYGTKLDAYAAALGLDTARLNACVDAGQTTKDVDMTLAEANRLGIPATPTFFINGRAISGALPLEGLEQLFAQVEPSVVQ